MIGGISAGGILGAKAVVKFKGGKREGNINVDKGVEKDNKPNQHLPLPLVSSLLGLLLQKENQL
jgi:hypothetical protein